MSATISLRPEIAPITHRLVQTLGHQRYDRWFGKAQLRLAEDALEVHAPSRFVADWINRHFVSHLRNAAEEACGQAVSVAVKASEPTASTQQDDQPAERYTPGQTTTEQTAYPTQTVTATSTPPAAMCRSRDATARAGSQSSAGLRYVLDGFVVGASNQLAFESGCRLVDDLDESLHPLFIHGGCGVGKTHLIQGLCRRFIERHPGRAWRYITAEQFTNEFIHAVRHNRIETFRRRVRQLDLLVLDDVHFVAGKSATQVELQHTFDSIDLNGAKVVLASDAHPKQIEAFSAALVSRCVSGMVARIDQPDPAMRLRLVRSFAAHRGLVLLDGVAEVIADRFAGSVRELEGLMTSLDAMARTSAVGTGAAQIGHALLGRLWNDPASPGIGAGKVIQFTDILSTACEQLGVEEKAVLGKSRHRSVVMARSITAYLARKLTTLSYPEIAARMRRNSHSTIVTAARRIDKQIADRQPLAESLPNGASTVDQLIDQLTAQLKRQVF